MPLAAGLGGARPPGKPSKPANGSGPTPGPSKPNPKLTRDSAVADDDDDDDQETTTDDSSDEEAAFEMDGQELWTQTYCVTCDCLIEPGEGIAKTGSAAATGSSPVTHSTLKSRSGTIKARGSFASDTADETKAAAASKHSPTATKTPGPAPLKRTHSAGRLHAKAGAGPLGPHKRTGSAGSRLHALSELRPTTKLHDDKPKPKTSGPDASHGRKSPAAFRPSSAASNRSHSNSSGPSSFKSNDATNASNANTNTSDGQPRIKKRGFLGGLGLTPAALKQQQDELAAKRKAPTPLYCSERCRLIDERRSSGLGELTQYLSQPLVPPTTAAWAPPPPPPPPPPHTWTRSASVSSMPLQLAANTPESECLCPECIDKYADGSSTSGAAIPSGASDTATESSSGYVYGRGAAQKPRTASGRLITPLGLHPPGASTEGYFPQYAPSYAMTPAAHNSPRVRPAEVAPLSEAARYSSVPPRSSSAASAGRASTAGTEGSVLSSASGSSLWEPRLKPRSNSGVRNGNGFNADGNGNATGTASGLSTSTATPAITPRQSMVVPSGSHNIVRAARRLSVPGFAPTHEVDEESQHQSEATRAISPASTLPHWPGSRSNQSSLLLATSPLKLLDKSSQHHAAPSIDLFSDHVGSPGARGSLLSRSLASEHTLMGASGITLTNQHTLGSSSLHDRAHLDSEQPQRQMSQEADSSGRRPPAMSQSYSHQTFKDPSTLDHNSRNTDSSDSLSMAVGSLKLAQSRASGPLAAVSRRGTESRPTDLRRLSLFGVAGAPACRNSNAVSISSSNSGSTSSGWLRSLSSAWLNWRSTASPAPMQTDSDVFHSTDDSDEWPHRGPGEASRRESSASRSSSSQKVSYAQKRASSMRDVSLARSSSQQTDKLLPTDLSRQPSHDRSAANTPTQSLVAKPTIRRGHVPAYVSEIGQGGIPGDSSPADAKAEASAAAAIEDPAQRLARARVDSFTRVTDADAAQKKASKRRSRDISVLPPLLAPISRSGSSTNLYGQMPRSARAYSTGRAWSAANTPQMYVGSVGSSHQQPAGAGGHGQPPHSPTLMRSPYHSSLALTQDAARAALSPSRPNSAAGYHSLQYSAGTSPRAKGLGWGAMTSIASPPASSSTSSAFPHHSSHRQSISYGHAAAVANRASVMQASRGHHHHQHHHHAHQHAHQHHHRHQYSWHEHGQAHAHSSSVSDQHIAANQGVALGHMMNLGAPPNSTGQPVSGRHSTMPAMLHRSPTPSVPEDGGEMTSQDLTSGDFVTRPNSAMAGQNGRRHHRTSLMPPPRSRSSMGMHPTHSHQRAVQPLTATDALPALTPASEDVDAEDGAQYTYHEAHREPPRTWSYDHLSGLKTYPILQLPDRETHDVYDPAWGLDAGGLAKHLGQDTRLPRSSTASQQGGDGSTTTGAAAQNGNGNGTVQMGFQPHRKKLFYFDA